METEERYQQSRLLPKEAAEEKEKPITGGG